MLASDKDAGPELELTRRRPARSTTSSRRGSGDEARIRRKGALIVHPDARHVGGRARRASRACAPPGVRCGLARRRRACASSSRELTGDAPRRVVLPRRPAVRAAGDHPRARARGGRRGAAVRTGCDGRGDRRRPARRVRGVRSAAASGSPRRRRRARRRRRGAAGLAATAGLELPVEPRWGQLVRLAAPARRGPRLVRHKIVDGSYLRSVASADAGLQVTTVIETTWEGDVLVGSSRARRGFDTAVDPAVSDAMVARAARLVPRPARPAGRRGLERPAAVAARPPARDRPVGARARACGWRPATRAPASRSGRSPGRARGPGAVRRDARSSTSRRSTRTASSPGQ